MKKSLIVLILILVVTGLPSSGISAEKSTLIGEVNDNHQIVADNVFYEVDDNATGDDLVTNYIAQKVKVVGKVKESGESKIITVESFEVIEE